MVHSQDQGLDESVNQAQRRFIDAISATDNASRLVVGGPLVDEDQDDYFDVKFLKQLNDH